MTVELSNFALFEININMSLIRFAASIAAAKLLLDNDRNATNESTSDINWANADPPIDVHEYEDGSTGFSYRY